MTQSDRKAEKEARKAQAHAAASEQALAAKRAEVEARFWAAPFGQARSAKLAGDRYFQIELPIQTVSQSTYSKAVADIKTQSRSHGGQGRVLTDIENEGWDLVHAGFVFKETGQVSRDKFLSSGQQVSTTGSTWGVYLFKATDAPARTDEVWLGWLAPNQ